MWPFVSKYKGLYEAATAGWDRALDKHREYRKEIAELKVRIAELERGDA